MFTDNNKTSKKLSFKTWMLMASVIAIVICSVGGTVAYLTAKTPLVVNEFKLASPGIDIDEELGEAKSNVRIQNTGEFDAYIRAKLVFTWKDAEGNVSAIAPKMGTDYSLENPFAENGWFQGSEGYFCYKTKVAPGAYTKNLINSCKKLKEGPEGYDLSVEVIAELIQAEPQSAVEEAWKVDAVNGNLQPAVH